MTTPQRLEIASLRLHQPGLTPEEIAAALEYLVTELRLAGDPVFVPAAVSLTDRLGQDPDRVGVEVRGAERIEGVLYCSVEDEAAVAWIRGLADHAGIALSLAARLRDSERREASVRRVAERLQDALLPRVPQVANSTIAVEYRAAARDTKVGGDFYDVFRLPDERVLIAIGDVMGKGMEAAVHTSRITQTLRALAMGGLDLAVLLERLDEQVTWQESELMATVWCGLYEPGSGELSFASLGHPPALLLRADGDPIRLELEGLPLGLRELVERPPEVRTRRLESRDLLVLYTDGVVEASKDYLAGQHALLDAIRRRREETVGEILKGALSDLLEGAGHSDDAAMLVLRRS
jgi:phosphoserine phosphatase RsbU/P